MRIRNLIILVVVAAALGAFIFFVERHQPTTDEHLESADRLFPELDVAAVVSAELTTSGGPIRLTLVNDEWRLSEPMDYPADATAVRSLVDAIANLDAERILPLGEVDPAGYGLDDPALGVVLTDSDGRRFSLAVGDQTPLGSNRAVRRGVDEEIVLCSDVFVAGLDKGVDQWRSRDVVEVLEHDLASVEIHTGEDRIHVVRIDERWWLQDPLADLADSEQMRSLISELNALRIGEFLDFSDDPSALGPDGPEIEILLVRSDGGEPISLEFGPEQETVEGASVVCRRDGVDVFRIPSTILTRLAKAPVLWRSPSVWPFSSWDVNKVVISSGDGEVGLQEVDGLWRLRDGEEADNPEVRRRLTALADLKALDFDLLVPPTRVIGNVVLGLDDSEITYAFFSPLEEGGHALVTVSARDNVMGIDAAIVETIVSDLARLRPAAESSPAEE